MKQNVLDRFSKTGRLRTRLDEIVQQVERRDLPRMEGGDLIGRQIVSNLVALPQRDEEEQQLLFDAQCARAVMYRESRGATALEAAEALVEARAVLDDGPARPQLLSSLADPAWAILEDLLAIGSRRNAWSCFRVVFDAVSVSRDHDALRPRVVDAFFTLVETAHGVESEVDPLDMLLALCDFARHFDADRFNRLVALIPDFLGARLEETDAACALQAYLFARHLCIGFDEALLQRLVRKLAAEGRYDAEARSVFNEHLLSDAGCAVALEADFERLAYVNPDPEIRFDADLDALNVMLTEHYADRTWLWQNRSLLHRRRGDSVAAIACLARALTISGEPPELLGLLAPPLLGMGFVASAREFARFASPDTRERFRLDTLDLIGDETPADMRREELFEQLRAAIAAAEGPPEAMPWMHARMASLLFEMARFDDAAAVCSQLLDADPTDELSAVMLAECHFRQGRRDQAERCLSADFGMRVLPLVEHLRSRMCEQGGDLARAAAHNDRAREILPTAQESGRETKQKYVHVLSERIARMHAGAANDGALMAMLTTEAHATRHTDLDRLAPVLQRRAIELAMRCGDVDAARAQIGALVERRPADTDIFICGARASLRAGKLAEAQDFLASAVDAGHGDSAEIHLLRGLVSAQDDDNAAASAFFSQALDCVPTAEARLAAAAMALDRGDESVALELLDGYSEEQGGTAEIRRRLHDLHGRLLERAGRTKDALAAYLDATAADDTWHDARRRAGLLAIELGLGGEGALADERLVRRGVFLLEGFNDSESVTFVATAEAAVAGSPDAGAQILRTALRRVTGDAWLRLMLTRVRYDLASDDTATAREGLEAILRDAGDLDDDLRASVRRCLAALLRVQSFDALSRTVGLADDAIRSIVGQLERARELSAGDAAGAGLVELVRSFLSGDVEVPRVTKATSEEIVVAISLANLGREGRNLSSRLGAIADEGEGEVALDAAAFLLALADRDGSAAELVERAEALERHAALPISRADLNRIAATKALRAGDEPLFDSIVADDPEGASELTGFRKLMSIAREGSGAESSRVLAVLQELGTRLGARESDFESKLLEIRNRVTELKETPSPAWASSRLRTADKRTRVVVPEVLQYWRRAAEEGADGDVRHHLALMQLASAHEQEAGGIDASETWSAAHDAWARLWRDEGWWTALAERIGDVEAVRVVRGRIPAWLLRAQLTLVKSRMFVHDLAGAIGHARVVASSPLLDCTDASIRDELFGALSGDLERHLQNKRYDEALAAIDHVIVADPQNPMARREMVRVAATILRPLLAGTTVAATSDVSAGDVCASMSRILAHAERAVADLCEDGVEDRDVAQNVAVCCRAAAWVAGERDRDPAAACGHLDRAIGVLEACGADLSEFAKLRADAGLLLVEERMGRTPTREHRIISDIDPVEEALAEVDHLLALDPDNVKVITEKARLLTIADRDDEAEALARELFQRAQNRAEPSAVRSAVELLFHVQSGRERFRYESRIRMARELVRKRNWRAALSMFKDAVVGRENEPEHLILHVEILLGLHKMDKIEGFLDQLEDCGEFAAAADRLAARFAWLRHVASERGDAYAAFELFDRGELPRAVEVAEECLDQQPGDPSIHLLLAVAHAELGESGRAAHHRSTALAGAAEHGMDWIRVILEDHETERNA